MTDEPGAIIQLGEERGDEAAALIARAFQDDPLFVFACPDPGERARWLPWIFRWGAWQGFLFGQTLGATATTGQLDGVAATIGPDGGELSEDQLARFGYGRGREAVGAEIWDRATGALNAAFEPANAALHRAVPGPHWYLDILAVEPTRQGQGTGSRLLGAVNALADADRVPVVLLTLQPRNLGLYQRHGYTVVCEGPGTASGPRWWGFRRDPGAAE